MRDVICIVFVILLGAGIANYSMRMWKKQKYNFRQSEEEFINTTEKETESQTQQRGFADSMLIQVIMLLKNCAFEDVRKQLDHLKESFQYCDANSAQIESARQIEGEIESEMKSLEKVIASDAAASFNKIEEIENLLKERNRICREKRPFGGTIG